MKISTDDISQKIIGDLNLYKKKKIEHYKIYQETENTYDYREYEKYSAKIEYINELNNYISSKL